LLLGPVTGLIPFKVFEGLVPYFAAFTLAIILFDSGLGFPLGKALVNAPRAIILAILGSTFSILAVTPLAMFVLGWSPTASILLGAIISGTSSVIVITTAGKLPINYKAKNMLLLESVFTDAIVVVVSVILIRILTLEEAMLSFGGVLREVVGSLIIGVILGGLLAFLLSYVIRKIQQKAYSDAFTLGAVMLVYGVAEHIGGNGAISVFTFGLILGNMNQITEMLRHTSPNLRALNRVQDINEPNIRSESRKFHAQIAFLMKTFFFALLGMMFYIPEPGIVLMSVGVVAGLFLARIIAVNLSSWGMGLSNLDKWVMVFICSRGLAAAVLASLTYQLPISETVRNITTQIIAFTAIITSLTPLIIKARNPSG